MTAEPKFRPGQWVKLPPNQGFVGASDKFKAQIDDQGDWGTETCMQFPDCGCKTEGREWPNLLTEPDPKCEGKRWNLCHVCENKMTPCEPPEEQP